MGTKRVSSPSAATEPCPNCRQRKVPHRSCPSCGYAGGNAASAEGDIYHLQQRINRYLMAGDTEEAARLQLQISQIQQKYAATHGTRKGQDNDPTA